VLPTENLEPEELASFKPGQVSTLYVRSLANGIELAKSLSLKQSGVDAVRDAMRTGLPIEGKVSGENKGGFTVELPGLQAFCPFSQMDVGPSKPLAAYLGQSFRFKVTRIEGRNVVLSRAALVREEQEVERKEILSKLNEGDTLLVSVVKIESFGVFVDIGGGLNALVPNSELSWSRQESARSICAVGDKLSVKIIRIETQGDKPRIAASVKQVEGDPWDLSVDRYETGMICEATITKLMAFGAFAEISNGIEGLIHISEMSSKKRVNQPGEVVKVGDKVQVRIVGIDRINKKISLSLKVDDHDVAEQEAMKEHADDEHRGVEFKTKNASATLGDAFLRAKSVGKKS
jgi:small subunit ribosomal protein S1